MGKGAEDILDLMVSETINSTKTFNKTTIYTRAFRGVRRKLLETNGGADASQKSTETTFEEWNILVQF